MTKSLVESARTIDMAAILKYAEITNDFNPLHVDPDFAAKSPMKGIIAHGMLSLNLIWQSARATFGQDAVATAELDIRFTKPVRVDDRVSASGEIAEEQNQEGRTVYDVWVKNQDGEAVIKGKLTI